MSVEKNPNPDQQGIERREFIKRAAAGAGAVAVGMVALGCSSGSSGGNQSALTSDLGLPANVPTPNAWSFAVMADTQWISADDGYNPNTVAVGLINQLNANFVAQKVKFVVQVGDLADQGSTASPEAGYKDGSGNPISTSPSVCEDTRALFAQTLYNSGIGFFPCRGNHDDGSPAEFIRIYPQTQNGKMNANPSDLYSLTAPGTDGSTQPFPAAGGSQFSLGSHFGSIGYPPNYQGLSYGFDYNNARFLLIDQFTPVGGLGPDGNAYAVQTTAAAQQPWIAGAYQGNQAGNHIFTFTHKGIILQQHIDVLFGDCPGDFTSTGTTGSIATGAQTYNVLNPLSNPVKTATYTVATGAANAFIRSMVAHNARYLFCGHDHNHSRSQVQTTDSGALAQITQVLCQSVSSKFYTPNEDDAAGNSTVPACTSNDKFFCAGQRQTMLSQELYTVGYYIVTVDGANVTVDYYSAPVPSTFSANTEQLINQTPTLNFTKRETFGYSLVGRQFIVPSGQPFTSVQDRGPSGTSAAILSGTNSNPNTDLQGRIYANDVETGWIKETATTGSDILVLWGMGHTLGFDLTDTFTLAMSYDKAKGSAFLLATPDGNGNWTNAVNENNGGTAKFVQGPWKSGYGLGTYGLDTASGTVWAVLNHDGYFAAVTDN